MPNDPAGSFPLPPTNSQPATETPKEEIKLTDAVAPDLSAAPVLEAPIAPPPAPAQVPASVTKPFPIVTLLLLLISTGAIAATYFFYQQTKSLNLQLTQITQTLEQQAIEENQITITPSPTYVLTPTPTGPDQTTTSPTPGQNRGTGPVWGIIDEVMASAQRQYPNAQLILIKAESANTTSQIIKYWFRQNSTDRKYLYLLKEIGKDLSLVDQNVTVYETSLLPSLNPLIASNQPSLLDLPEAVTIATAVCPTTFDCVNNPITGQFAQSEVPLWQITYKPANGGQPFVIQIDAITKKILYKSL